MISSSGRGVGATLDLLSDELSLHDNLSSQCLFTTKRLGKHVGFMYFVTGESMSFVLFLCI